MAASPIKVGVLGLQGNFELHLKLLGQLGASVVPVDVRDSQSLHACDCLIIPGGESSALRAVLFDGKDGADTFLQDLRQFSKTFPVWGVCAGMIMLADDVEIEDGRKEDPLVGGLGITARRNFFGRQSHSSLKALDLKGSAKDFGCLEVSHFIRAPVAKVSSTSGAEVLAIAEGQAVAVRNGHLLGTSFHPEITQDKSWHLYFLNHVCGRSLPKDGGLPCVGANMLYPHGMQSEDAQGNRRALSADEVAKIVSRGMTHMKGDRDTLASSLSAKYAMPRFLHGGVIMDVVTSAQAKIAEAAGACAVMALERIPADIKAEGGIARSTDPRLIKEIMQTVSNLPVMAKARIGHFGEARILEALEVDTIDESEVLTAADEKFHIHKHDFKVPFVCGAKDLGEAFRRITEGASMIRLKGDAGTGNVVHAVRHARQVFGEIKKLQMLPEDEIFNYCKERGFTDIELVKLTRRLGRLPVTTFAAGGIATPADVAMMMALGCDGVFVGSGIFKGENSADRARAMVKACTWWEDPLLVAEVSEGLGKGMVGILATGERYAFAEDDKLYDSDKILAKL